MADTKDAMFPNERVNRPLFDRMDQQNDKVEAVRSADCSIFGTIGAIYVVEFSFTTADGQAPTPPQGIGSFPRWRE